MSERDHFSSTRIVAENLDNQQHFACNRITEGANELPPKEKTHDNADDEELGAMSPNIHQHTAKIYQFPRRNPAHVAKLGLGADALADLRQRGLPSVESGSGWYHDKAIEDGRAASKP